MWVHHRAAHAVGTDGFRGGKDATLVQIHARPEWVTRWVSGSPDSRKQARERSLALTLKPSAPPPAAGVTVIPTGLSRSHRFDAVNEI